MRPINWPSFVLASRRRQQARRSAAQRYLIDQPPRAIGQGAFSSVFASGRSRVLKISDRCDATVPWCIRWMRRHPCIHWPRIYKIIQSPRYNFVWMERLSPLEFDLPKKYFRRGSYNFGNPKNIRLSQAGSALELPSLCSHSSLSELESYYEYIGESIICPPRLREPLLHYISSAKGMSFSQDGKREAFMWRRGGTLVAVDLFIGTLGRRL